MDVVEQERQRSEDKSPSKRFPHNVCFLGIFAVCIVVDIAVVVVEGLKC